MMPKILLLNPSQRKGAKMAKHRRSAAQKRATAKLVALNRSRRRSANPARKRAARRVSTRSVTVMANPRRRRSAARRSMTVVYANPRRRTYRRRRANPVAMYRRRRRNPINLGGVLNMRNIISTVKEAAILGGGAVAMDVLYGKIAEYLPASMQRTPGSVGTGDAVKMLLTALIGAALNRPTRGLARKAALGSIAVQIRDIAAGFLPAGMTMGGLGYSVPAPMVNINPRIYPNTRRGIVVPPTVYYGTEGRSTMPTRIGGYINAPSPLLNGYINAPSPLLNGRSARERDGVSIR